MPKKKPRSRRRSTPSKLTPRSPSKQLRHSRSKQTLSSESEDPPAVTPSTELSPVSQPDLSLLSVNTSRNNCPPWLHTKPIASEKWHELYEVLQARGQLELCDLDLLSLYCEGWQQIIDADLILEREGEFQTTEKGYAYAHPAVQKRNTAVERVKKIASDLGIGFRSRKGTRGAGGASDTSELDDF